MQQSKESFEKQNNEQESVSTAKGTKNRENKENKDLEKESNEDQNKEAVKKNIQERQNKTSAETLSSKDEEGKKTSENPRKDNSTQKSRTVTERHDVAELIEKIENRVSSPITSKTLGVSSIEEASQTTLIELAPITSPDHPRLDEKREKSKKSKEDTLEVQPTMDSDLSEGRAAIEVSGLGGADVGKSPMKDSQVLDPSRENEVETNIMDLVARYEEQPTMLEKTLRVFRKIRPRKKTTKPKLVLAPPRRIASRQITSKEDRRKKTYDEETVFDNEDDAKKDSVENPYDNLGEDEEEEEDEEKGSAMKDVIGEEESAEGTYENLPTPPDPREMKKQMIGRQRRKLKTAIKPEQGEMRTAERLHTLHVKRRKGTVNSESTLQTETANEMISQNESEPMRAVAEDLSGVHMDGMFATEDEDMETALLTLHTIGRARRTEVKTKRAQLRVTKTTSIRTFVDILGLICLLPLVNEFYVVPIETLKHGGLAFLLLYIAMVIVLVIPVLSLVLFVSQYTQTGIIHVFGMYGPLFEGVGYGYLSIIFMLCTSIIYKGSILIKHNAAIVFDSLSIGSCAGYPTSECDCDGVAMFIIHLLQLSVLGVLAANGPTVMLAMLGVMTAVLIMVLLVNNILAVNDQSINLLWRLSDFGELSQIGVWIQAARLAFYSSGLGEASVFCASSFRSPRGRYLLTSAIVIVSRMLFCILGLFSLLDGSANLIKKLPNYGKVLLPKNSDIVSSPSVAVDIYSISKDFSHRLYDNAEIMYIFHIAPGFAPIFTMYAMARKHGASTFLEYLPFIGAFLIFCSFYSFLICMDVLQTLLHSHNKLMIACSLHFYMALSIFLFTFCYGFKELNSDIRFIFPRTRPCLRKLREFWHKGAFLISVIFLVAKQKKTWHFTQECLAIILAPIPFIIPAAAVLLKRRSLEKNKLIFLSNTHPTKRRYRLQKARRRKKRLTSAKSRMSRSDIFSSEETRKDVADIDNITGSSEVFDTKGNTLTGSKVDNVENQSKGTIANDSAKVRNFMAPKKVEQ